MVVTTPQPQFDTWVEQMPLKVLEAEQADIQARFDELLADFQKKRDTLVALQDDLGRRNKIIEVLKEIQAPGEQADDGDADEAADDEATMKKREIAARILKEEDHPLFPREVRDIEVERGWLPATGPAANQLAVAMNRATKQGHLAKDDEGRYFLPRLPNGSALFGDDSEGGDGP
jgi:hypothetical protein